MLRAAPPGRPPGAAHHPGRRPGTLPARLSRGSAVAAEPAARTPAPLPPTPLPTPPAAPAPERPPSDWSTVRLPGRTLRHLRDFDSSLQAGVPGAVLQSAERLRCALRDLVQGTGEVGMQEAALEDLLFTKKERGLRAFRMLLAERGHRGALALVDKLPAPPSTRVRRSLLRAGTDTGNLGITQRLVNALQAGGGQAADDCASSLLTALGRAKQAPGVADAVDAMLGRGCASTVVMNAALRAYINCSDGQAAFSTYVRFRRMGAAPNTRTYNELIRAARIACLPRRVHSLWARMLRLGPRPDQYTRAVVLCAAADCGAADPDWLLAVHAAGDALGLEPSWRGVTALAYAMRVCPRRAPEHVRDVFAVAARVRAALGLDVWAYSELMQLAAAAGEPERAADLAAACIEDGCTPSVFFYSALFKCVAVGPTREMMDLADASAVGLGTAWRRVRPLIARARSQMAGGAKRQARGGGGGAPGAPQFLSPPRPQTSHDRRALRPDDDGPKDARMSLARADEIEADFRIAYNALLHALAAGGRRAAARAVLDGMVARGPAPDTVTYNAAIDAAAQVGAVDAAFALHAEMVATHLAPDVETFGSLMHACARGNSLPHAERVLQAAKEAGVEPSVQLLTSLMAAAVAAGDPDRAHAVLASARAAGLEPTSVTYGVLIAACERRADVEGAFALYREAIAAGLMPTDETHSCLVAVCDAAGKFDSAVDLVRGLARAGPGAREDALNSLARALAGRGHADRALRMLSLLRTLGHMPERRTVDAVLGAAARGGRLAAADAAHDDLRARGLRPSRQAASDLIVALCAAGRLSRALDVYRGLVRDETLGAGGRAEEAAAAASAVAAVRAGRAGREWADGGLVGDGDGAVGGEGGGESDSREGPGAAAGKDAATSPASASPAATSPASASPAAISAGAAGSASTAPRADAGSLSSAPALSVPEKSVDGPRATTASSSRPAPGASSARPVRVRPAASGRTRRASAAASTALVSLVTCLASAGDVDAALDLYDSLRRRGGVGPRGPAGGQGGAGGAFGPTRRPPVGAGRMWEALIQACCLGGRVDAALFVFDDWRAAADAAHAAGKAPPAISAAALAFLEATLRAVPGDTRWRVYDVCAAMRTQAYRASQQGLAWPAKASHHVLGAVEGVGGDGDEEASRGVVAENDEAAPAAAEPSLGPAAAAAAARRALLSGPQGAAVRRQTELEASRTALRARLAARQAARRADGGSEGGVGAGAGEPVVPPPAATPGPAAAAAAEPAPSATAGLVRPRPPKLTSPPPRRAPRVGGGGGE